MKSQLIKEVDGTIKLTVTIPSETIKKAWLDEVNKVVASAALPGFRKGKAPKKLVEEKLDREKVREDILKKILPSSYLEAVNEHNLRPIISPKIHIEKIEDPIDNKEVTWQFTATTSEAPEVSLGNYKEAVKSITAKSKIIVPGKEKKEPNMDEIIGAVLSTTKMTVPSILIEGEVERLLAQLLDEVKSLGLSLDQYLGATKKSVQELRDDYTKKAGNDLKFEFVLQKIADDERIKVEQAEIEEAIQKAKDEKERKNLESNRYLLASILRQQKTLDFLKNL